MDGVSVSSSPVHVTVSGLTKADEPWFLEGTEREPGRIFRESRILREGLRSTRLSSRRGRGGGSVVYGVSLGPQEGRLGAYGVG